MKTDGLVQWCRYKLTVCTRKETSLQEGTDDLEFAKVCLVSPLSKLCLFLSESEDIVVSSSEVKNQLKLTLCSQTSAAPWQVRQLKHVFCITVNHIEIKHCVLCIWESCHGFFFCLTVDVSWVGGLLMWPRKHC